MLNLTHKIQFNNFTEQTLIGLSISATWAWIILAYKYPVGKKKTQKQRFEMSYLCPAFVAHVESSMDTRSGRQGSSPQT
ncbi:protein BOLA2 [Iris pallida]|uniref:Protein BOLA2 n=1 Tax=Iris pallida TaxID=29817 RepID=A0AAX6EH92_IRIPA|nr:protein BOLA2 [Iris pallida]